jgi:protein SCO1/2
MTGSCARRSLVLLATLVATITIGACGGGSGSSPTTIPSGALHGIVPKPPIPVTDATFPEVTVGGDNGPFELVAPDGGLLAVYFGYTNCPDICPTTMSDLAAALGQIDPDQAEKVSVAFITVDPTRDTPEVLTSYLQAYFTDRYHALRNENRSELHALEDKFGVTSELAQNPDGSVEVGHSSIMAVVDDEANIRLMWPFGVKPADMASDIERLLADGAA